MPSALNFDDNQLGDGSGVANYLDDSSSSVDSGSYGGGMSMSVGHALMQGASEQ